jgi:RNA polymerase sigma factor (sigma-70 family)
MLLNRVGGDSHRADDLSQRTWAGLWRSLQSGNYDPERSAISTYVYAVAYRTWLHDVRQTRTAAGVRGVDHFEDLPAVGSSPEPDAATHLSQAIDAVRSALAGREVELGDDERDLLRAIAAGESDRAIAKRLGLAASTVNVRKQSALTKLRRILARQGFRGESSERDAAVGKQPDEP